jgi:hypothetical protein
MKGVKSQNEQAKITLWQDVPYGITREELRAIRSDTVDSQDELRLGNGDVCALVIPGYELLGRRYSVLFYFTMEGLTQVTIKCEEAVAFSDFQTISEALTLKYGHSISRHEQRDGFSSSDWIADNGVNVSVVCFPEISCLNINYQVRLVEAASKL